MPLDACSGFSASVSGYSLAGITCQEDGSKNVYVLKNQRMSSYHISGASRAVSVILLFFLCRVSSSAVSIDHVNVGFTATAIGFVDTNGIFLYSVNQSFSFGFSSLGTGGGTSYYLCILHFSSSQTIWCANRNSPVGLTDLFSFNSDGSAALVSSGATIWSSNTTGGSLLQLQESGNLVLLNVNRVILWQSFDHPTDTLLSGQRFSSSMMLIASSSQSDISEGLYYLSMDKSGLTLYDNISSQVFWTMAQDTETNQLNPGGVPAYAEIAGGNLELLGSDDVTIVSEIVLDSYDQSTIRRATLESDGNLRVYFLSGSLWNLAFVAVRDLCSLPEFCGAYGLCSNAQCSCPATSVPNNSTDFKQGCSPYYVSSCKENTNLTVSPLELYYIGNVDYYANQFTQPLGPYDLNTCKQFCMDNCSCTVLFFHNESGSCFLWSDVGTIRYDSSNNHLAFLKVPQSIAPSFSRHSRGGSASYVIILIAFGTTFIIIGLLLGAGWLHRRRQARLLLPNTEDDDELLVSIPGLPTRFSYKELEAATNSFKLKLGSGGFGSVYEGLLADKTKIAVKRLESVGQGKKEFWAEVATIGSIHHVHLVQLRGFCAEGAHRLLVYEFMANGSLAKVLFSHDKDEIVLDWHTRCKISIATARGLAYLHEDCRERIIHCDIKPENILLDENFVAKVSDFGLAKLMNPEQSEVFTTLRGTRGYLAPEWLLNSSISDRSDVYSFGMVLLELISGRKNYDPTEMSEKWYFPIYAYRQAEVGNVQVLADPKLEGIADANEVATLTRVALWCIQDEVAMRPSMKKVVKMIEGIIEVPKPPSSPQLAVRLHGRKFDSGNDSGISDFDSSGLSASCLSAPR